MVGIAARVVLDDDGAIETAGIGMTSVDITNARSTDAEAVLEGEVPTAERFREAGEAAAAEANPETDEHGSFAYKENMVRVLTQRALADAVGRAGGDVPPEVAG